MTLLAYLFYFTAATAAPIQRRRLAKRNEGGNKIDLSFRISLIAAILALTLPLFSPFQIHGSYQTIIFLLILSALGGIGFNLCYFTAQGHVEAGVTSVLGNIYTPITIILSTLFLGEGLRGIQIIGTIVLLVAAIIVSKKHRIGKVTYDKYFWLMISSGVFLSILLVAQRELMKMTGFTASTILSWWSICISLGILTLFIKSKTTYTKKDLTITGVMKFFQDLAWAVLTYFVANLSFVSAITTFKIVIIFIVAALFLGEKEDFKRKIFGCLVAVAGLLLMI